MSTEGCCEVEAMIADFLANTAATSLELPHMTTGQRKQVKKLALNSELVCESYGFGPERRLHLFKKPTISSEAAELGDDGPNHSTTASGEDSSTSSTPPCTDSEQERFEPELRIRNTFIHFDGAIMDSRIIQSMPHGMFKRSLEDELVTQQEIASPVAVDEVVRGQQLLSPGLEVVIEGLSKAPAFNGRHGIVNSYDEESGRYSIALSCTKGAGASQVAKVKPENLRLAVPPPPRFTPSIALDESQLQGTDGCVPSTPEWGDRVFGASPLMLTALVC